MSDRLQHGFSLVETLFSLLLFSLTITALIQYQQVLAAGFQQQWQQRLAWRNAWQLLEGNSLIAGQNTLQQRSGPAGCLLLISTAMTPVGRKAELTLLRCPPVQNPQ